MRRRVALLLAALAVLGVIAAGAMLWQPTLVRGTSAPPADAAHCAVYRSFHAYVGGGNAGVYFMSTTESLGPPEQRMAKLMAAAGRTPFEKRKDHASPARVPGQFDRVAEGATATAMPPDHSSAAKAARQSFALDTSRFFEPLKEQTPLSIRTCFSASAANAKFLTAHSRTWSGAKRSLR